MTSLTLLQIAGALNVAAWIYLLAMHGRFWHADQRLDPNTPERSRWPDVVAIIPARNESETIASAVDSHVRSDYPGQFDLIVIDDQSDDGTASVASQAASAGSRSVTILKGAPIRSGWSGKLWALQQGFAEIGKLFPDAAYVLLTDADIVHPQDSVRRLVEKAEREKLSLVSLMALLDSRGIWGGLLVPAFVFFFQKLYPFPRANNPDDRMAAAAGGCVLVRRDVLEERGGVAEIRGALIDDCALAALIKGDPPDHPIWIGLTRDVRSLRDNRSLASVWTMVSRTAFTQLNHSVILLLGCIVGMIFLYGLPPALILFSALYRDGFLLMCGLAGWVSMAVAYRPTGRLYDRAAWETVLLPISAALYTGMTVSSAINHWRGTGGRWKGRTYPATPT